MMERDIFKKIYLLQQELDSYFSLMLTNFFHYIPQRLQRVTGRGFQRVASKYRFQYNVCVFKGQQIKTVTINFAV